uniref:Protein argonaute-2-like n=1 Tax=Psoroptes ovis TaxID=83912 RepID=A0A3B0QPF5_PSOOV|nr:protein argonaute-2-like [Psoroptes ovis]
MQSRGRSRGRSGFRGAIGRGGPPGQQRQGEDAPAAEVRRLGRQMEEVSIRGSGRSDDRGDRPRFGGDRSDGRGGGGGGGGGYRGRPEHRGDTGRPEYGRDRGGGDGGRSEYGRDRGGGGDAGNFVRPKPKTFSSYPETEQYAIEKSNEFPHGESGKKIELLANYMKINIQPMLIYHYNLDFDFIDKEDLEVEKDREKMEKINLAKQKYFIRNSEELFKEFFNVNRSVVKSKYIVHDNYKNFYFTQTLNVDDVQKNLTATIEGRTKKFSVKFSLVNTIDLTGIIEYYAGRSSDVPRVAISFLELLFHNVASSMYHQHRRNLYDTNNGIINTPKRWAKFAQGFSMAVHLTEMGPSLNLHLKTSCLISFDCETLLQLVALIGDGDPKGFNEREIGQVSELIHGLEVYTTHIHGRKNKVVIKSLTSRRPKDITFLLKNDDKRETPISVQEYFQMKYNITPEDYPCVLSMNKQTAIPLELCFMKEKQFLNNSKMDGTLTNELLRMATHKPIIYFNHVANFSKTLANDVEQLSHYGVELLAKPVRFNGRQLDPPRLCGAGRNERLAKTFGPIEWAFFSLDGKFSESDIEQIVRDIKQTGERYGMDLSRCLAKVSSAIGKDDIRLLKNIFLNILKKIPNVKLLFFVLPHGTSKFYQMIKHFGDQKFGIATQCMEFQKVKRRNRGYLENLLLKVNGKLCGKNSFIEEVDLKSLPIDHTKTMAIGIDVNHPNDREKIQSSIACAIGSYDHQFTLYSASVCVQKREKDEMVTVLEEMIDELLDEYVKVNNYLPENFIVFRDGISEGQFEYAESEINQIRTAIRKRIKKGKMVYIVTQKGHQTRFALKTPGGTPDRPVHNVPPGTVVDHTITDPNYCTFFINSHFSQLVSTFMFFNSKSLLIHFIMFIQGTSRPLKYVVLHNDYERRQLNMDGLEKLCFYLCHNCTRYRGTIALPVPVRYADLCAYRSKLHLEAQHFSRDIPPANMEEFERHVIQQLNRLVKLNEQLKNSLFYC